MHALRADMITPLCEKILSTLAELAGTQTPEKRVVVAEESQAQAGPGEKMRLSGRIEFYSVVHVVNRGLSLQSTCGVFCDVSACVWGSVTCVQAECGAPMDL